MGFVNWVRKKMGILALAMANVEKDALTQTGLSIDTGASQEQRLKQGRLSDALQRGEITQEVKDLRWRMYKVMQASEGLTSKIVGYDDEGFPIIETKQTNRKLPKNLKVENSDENEVHMIVNNAEVTASIKDAVSVEAMTDSGLVSADEHLSNLKGVRPINIIRDIRPRFAIESFAKKMVVKKVDETKRVLDLYISMYPDEYDRKTRLLISEINKAKVNPRSVDFLEIKELSFITNKTAGAMDFHLYEYQIDGLHSIAEYDGNYVIKFNATVLTDGYYIMEDYREADLDKRYENKERKPNR